MATAFRERAGPTSLWPLAAIYHSPLGLPAGSGNVLMFAKRRTPYAAGRAAGRAGGE
jgi:hypothetical protein